MFEELHNTELNDDELPDLTFPELIFDAEYENFPEYQKK